ncbi:MAG: hypothetical protein JNM81_00780 [Rhodospirillaceae bacterium]|nr:hypothetical protein [Rhodospirillaceae bacterium]
MTSNEADAARARFKERGGVDEKINADIVVPFLVVSAAERGSMLLIAISI